MESLKQLLDDRAKLLADAQVILDRSKTEGRTLSSEESAQADGLLDRAGDADLKIQERKKGDRIQARADDFKSKLSEDMPRQTAYSLPGATPPRGGDGATVTLSIAGHELHLKAGSREHHRAQAGYRENFAKYLGGQGSAEQLGLQVSKDPKGGYLAPPQFVMKLIKFIDDMVFMRQIATVLPPMPTAVSLGVPVYTADPNDSDWTAEIPSADIAEDDNMAFAKREFIPHLFTKLVKASRKLIRSSILDIETWIAQRLAYKFAITEEKAYLVGSGSQQPLGVFIASADGLPTTQDVAAASSTVLAYDDLVNTLTTLKVQYQKNATWLVNRAFVKAVRKLKNTNGDPLWSGGFNGIGLVSGMPDTILGRPYIQSEYTPNTYTTGLYVAALGDFKAGYWIGDSLELEVEMIDQLFTLRNQVGFLGRKETDGAPVLPESIVRLKMA